MTSRTTPNGVNGEQNWRKVGNCPTAGVHCVLPLLVIKLEYCRLLFFRSEEVTSVCFRVDYHNLHNLIMSCCVFSCTYSCRSTKLSYLGCCSWVSSKNDECPHMFDDTWNFVLTYQIHEKPPSKLLFLFSRDVRGNSFSFTLKHMTKLLEFETHHIHFSSSSSLLTRWGSEGF